MNAIKEIIIGGQKYKIEMDRATAHRLGTVKANILPYSHDKKDYDEALIDIDGKLYVRRFNGVTNETYVKLEKLVKCNTDEITKIKDAEFLAAGDNIRLKTDENGKTLISAEVDIDIDTIETNIANNSSDITKNSDRISKLEEINFETLATELAESRGELATAAKDLDVARGELSTATTELAETRGELETTTTELAESRGELATAAKDLDVARGELVTATADLDVAIGELSTATTELEVVKGELSTATTELSESRGELSTATADLEVARGELSTATADLEVARGELSTATAELVNAIAELEAARAELEKLQ